MRGCGRGSPPRPGQFLQFLRPGHELFHGRCLPFGPGGGIGRILQSLQQLVAIEQCRIDVFLQAQTDLLANLLGRRVEAGCGDVVAQDGCQPRQRQSRFRLAPWITLAMRWLQAADQIGDCLRVVTLVARGNGEIDQRGHDTPFVAAHLPKLQRLPEMLFTLFMTPKRGQLDTEPIVGKRHASGGAHPGHLPERGARSGFGAHMIALAAEHEAFEELDLPLTPDFLRFGNDATALLQVGDRGKRVALHTRQEPAPEERLQAVVARLIRRGFERAPNPAASFGQVAARLPIPPEFSSQTQRQHGLVGNGPLHRMPDVVILLIEATHPAIGFRPPDVLIGLFRQPQEGKRMSPKEDIGITGCLQLLQTKLAHGFENEKPCFGFRRAIGQHHAAVDQRRNGIEELERIAAIAHGEGVIL